MSDHGNARPLAGQVALVTGGVRRIGRATALKLAAKGCAVVVNTRSSRDEAEALAAELEGTGVDAAVALADVTDEGAVAAMLRTVGERFGRLDILVNNAADRAETPFLEMSLAEWRRITGPILDGAFLCAREALKLMVAAGNGGVVVNIGGLTAHTGAKGRPHVVAAKAGLVGLTKAIAVEFGEHGVVANCVVPGKIGGPRAATAGSGGQLAAHVHSPVGREGRPEEVANVVQALCVPEGRYVTGQTIHVSGGLYMP
jgi:3-oxoacyl-[acyl-carrier protein] reductase